MRVFCTLATGLGGFFTKPPPHQQLPTQEAGKHQIVSAFGCLFFPEMDAKGENHVAGSRIGIISLHSGMGEQQENDVTH